MTDLRETLSVIADWCDCDHPAYGIRVNRHLPSCRYGIVEDAVDGTGLTIARVAPSDGLRERMVAEFVGVEAMLNEALQRTQHALALATTGQPEPVAPSDGLEVHVNDGSAHDRAMAWSEGHTAGWNEAQDALRDMLRAIPASGLVEGANRYDTDDMHVLHVWRDGVSWDIEVPLATTGQPGRDPAMDYTRTADPGGLRAIMRDALSKAHTAKDIDRFLDDYFRFALTPEATAPRAMTIGEWEALPYTKVEPDEGYG